MSASSPKIRWVYGLIVLTLLTTGLSTALGLDLSAAAAQDAHPMADYVIARVYYTSRSNLDQLAAFLDVWEVNHSEGYLVALLSPSNVAQLERTGYQLVIDQAQTALLTQQLETIPSFPCYRTVEETYATMTSLALDYPQLAELIDIGDSWEKVAPDGPLGYDIFALRLTNEDSGVLEDKPTFFLMAEIHARELVTTETAARYAEHLLVNYKIDADITWLLDHYIIYIVALSNPDGRKFAESGELWRKNTNNTNGCVDYPYFGTDLNRNHSFHWGESSTDPCNTLYQGPAPASEPETLVIQNFVLSLFADQRGSADTDAAPLDTTGLLISLHSYSQLVLWPWGWTDTDSPNHTQLQTLGRRMAYFTDYMPQQAHELYKTTGTTDDWAYGELGIAAYTFEMGTVFFQDCASFESTIYPDNQQALLYAFKTARQPYMDPAGPRVIDLALSQSQVDPGMVVTLSAAADDDLYSENNGREPTQPINTARYSLDIPSWLPGAITYPMEATDGNFNANQETLQATIDTTGLTAGKHIIFVEAMDDAGNWGVPTALFLEITGLITTFIPLLYR